MNIPGNLIDGDTCLYRTAGIVGEIVSWKEGDYLGIDHVAKFIRGKLFSALSKQGICFYDFTTTGLVMVRRNVLQFNLSKFDAWAPTVLGAPYGWQDIEAEAGFKVAPHIGVPPADLIHKTGADCDDTCAMADEIAECPSFDPAFDKRHLNPFDFAKVLSSTCIWLNPR
jgi:hypothetical protein